MWQARSYPGHPALLCMALTITCSLLGGFKPADAEPETVTIFAASSLAPALDIFQNEIAATQPLRLSSAGSGTIAKQIRAGAPADIFISANEEWMQTLADDGFIVPGSERLLATNHLVLIASRRNKLPDLPAENLMQDRKVKRIAIGETSTVPAGIYAREALLSLGLWESVKPKLLPAYSVRNVLAWVERREADLGFVYESDALGSDKVVILHRFLPDEDSAIRPATYVMAVVKGHDSPSVLAVLEALQGPAMAATLKDLGFSVPDEETAVDPAAPDPESD